MLWKLVKVPTQQNKIHLDSCIQYLIKSKPNQLHLSELRVRKMVERGKKKKLSYDAQIWIPFFSLSLFLIFAFIVNRWGIWTVN